MEENTTKKLLLAIGNMEIEEQIRLIQNTEICDSDSNIDLIADVLNYEEIDFVIVNTVLSEAKSISLAQVSKEKGAKVIAMVESHENKELIASLIGLGVTAFVNFSELKKIAGYINNYPEEFDFGKLQNKAKQGAIIPAAKKRQDASFKGKIFIGVFDICSGAGATTTAITMAENLATSGCKVICVELSGKSDFKYIDPRKCKAEYFIPDQAERNSNFEYLYRNTGYQFIIFDFGKVYDISSDGELLGIDVKKNMLGELLRCNYKIAVTFSDVWHEDKLRYFTDNNEFRDEIACGQFHVLISGAGEEEAIQKYGGLTIYKRDDLELFLDEFKESAGILEEDQAPRKMNFKLLKWARRKE